MTQVKRFVHPFPFQAERIEFWCNGGAKNEVEEVVDGYFERTIIDGGYRPRSDIEGDPRGADRLRVTAGRPRCGGYYTQEDQRGS